MARTLLFILLLIATLSHGQNYPVHVYQQLPTPAPTKLLDFYTGVSPWQVGLTLKDLSESRRIVRVQVTIEHQKLRIQTNLNTIPGKLFTLFPAVPVQLTPGDLADLLASPNTSVSGSYANNYHQTGILPEGVYSFCVTVYDQASREQISSTSCQSVWVRYLQPPLLIAPACETVRSSSFGQNLLFQWQEINVLGPTISADVRYTITLLEVTDPLIDPYIALRDGKVFKVFERSGIVGTSYHYNMGDPPLREGTRYVWTIQADVASGSGVYQNSGLGRPCWFSFGYPTGGALVLHLPTQGHTFRSNQQQVFSWSGVTPSLANQPFEYELVIMDCDAPPLADTVSDSLVVYRYRSPKTFVTTGWSHKVNKRFGADSCFRWQVKAYSDQQLVAASAIRDFSGPPLVEQFFAGPHEVLVLETFNQDMDSLCGVGSIRRNADGDTLCFRFDGLSLARVAGRFVLQSGVVQQAGRGDRIQFRDSANGNGQTEITKYRLTSNGLEIKGIYNQIIPLTTSSEERMEFFSDWTDFNSFRINAVFKLRSKKLIELLDPYGFTISYDTACSVKLLNGYSTASLTGTVVSERMKTLYGSTFHWPFKGQTKFDYMRDSLTTSLLDVNGRLVLVEPETYLIDFSDNRSIGGEQPYWKGINVDRFKLHVHLQNEISGQFSSLNNITFSCLDTDSCRISSQGLSLYAASGIGYSDSLLFNTFRSRPDSLVVNVRKGVLGRTYFKGSIRLPFLKGGEYFSYSVPIYYSGFGTGYLEEAFTDYKVAWNQFAGDQRIDITLKRGEFQDNQKLVFTAEYNWLGLSADFGQVDGLTIWGNNNVGFWIPNGITNLCSTVTASFGGFNAQVSYLGAGRNGNLYALGTQGEMLLAENVSGIDGAPKANAFSISRNAWVPNTFIDDTASGPRLGSFGSGSGGIGSFPDPSGGSLPGLIDDAFGTLGPQNLQVDSSGYGLDDIRNPTYGEGVGITLEDVNKLLLLLERFGNAEQQEKGRELRAVLGSLDEEELVELLASLRDLRSFVNKLLGKQVEFLTEICQGYVTTQVDSVNNFITRSIANQVDTVYSKVDNLVSKGYDAIVERTLKQIGNESVRNVLVNIADASKSAVMSELRRSLQSSVDENLTTKFTNFIDTVVTSNVNRFVEAQIVKVGNGLIDKEARGELSMTGFREDVGGLVRDVGDDIKTGFSTVSLPAIGNTIARVGEDTYKGFNWDQVGRDLVARLLGSNIEDSLKGLIGDFIQRNAGDVAAGVYGGIARNIDLDFSDLKGKLKQGELASIISFDPTYIYINTKAVDVEGYLGFTKDDPVWGDSWQAELNARMKKPFEASGRAKILNGRKDDFNYWFVEVAIPSGLNVMVIPSMLLMDGIGGKFYHHMTYLQDQQEYLPTDTVDLGLGLDLYLKDFATYGKTVQLRVGARATFFENGYSLGIEGKVDLGNKEGYPPFATGTGYLAFNSSSAALTGNFQISTNTAPLLCASGSMGLDIRPGWWEFYMGRRTAPVSVSVLCADFLRQDAWLTLNKNAFELSLSHTVDLNLRSPWLSLGQRQIRPFARTDFRFNALVKLDLQPRFRMRDSYLNASSYVGVGCDWKKNGKQGVWELAAVNFNGTLQYASEPSAKLTGAMNGRLSILGVDVQLGMTVDQAVVR